MNRLKRIVGILFLIESLGVVLFFSYCNRLDIGAGVACWVSGALGIALLILMVVSMEDPNHKGKKIN